MQSLYQEYKARKVPAVVEAVEQNISVTTKNNDNKKSKVQSLWKFFYVPKKLIEYPPLTL